MIMLPRRAVICLAILLWCDRAFALNPALDISQYAHTAWRVRDGFAKGPLSSIAQTPDGYLWLGSKVGLLRFDGVRVVPWESPPNQPLPSDEIWSLLATRDGALWVGTAKGLARWKDGRLSVYAELAGRIVWGLLEDHDHTVWASAASVPTGRLCTIRDREVKCVGDDGRLGYGAVGLHEDSKGNIWLGVADGLWRWAPGAPAFFPAPGEADAIQGFDEDGDGTLLVTTRRGIRRFASGRADAYPLTGPATPLRARHLLRDRDGALWIGTTSGLAHSHGGKTDMFTDADGLSGRTVQALFEDREGNIWVATTGGFDRFRDMVVSTVSEKQGLSNSRASAIAIAADGGLWLRTPDSLEKWQNGRFISYGARARLSVDNTRQRVVNGFPEGVGPLFPGSRDRIWMATASRFGYLEHDRFIVRPDVPVRIPRSFAEDSEGTVWIADQTAGLISLAPTGHVGRTAWPALGRRDFATAIVADPVRPGLWAGFWDGGIGYVENGRMRETYSAAEGLGQGRVTSLRFAPDGSLLVATQGGLSRLWNGAVATLNRRNGLPCDSIHWVMPDDLGAWWLSTPCGLIRVARDQIEAWMTDATRSIAAVVFDGSDGAALQGEFPDGYEPFFAKAPDGRLWFVGPNGVSIVDPRRLNLNPLPPPVHIEQIVADHKPFDVVSGNSRVDLPALTRDLQIDYTALSFVAPEKVRFRYMLDGYDRDWRDAGNRRQAFYTNLSPRQYRFRVIASNNSGVWNETGAAVAFAIAPAYYQTRWFTALAISALAALVWAGHRVRLRIVEKHQSEISTLNERLMKAQEQERIRIAGELHDGVMQDMLAVTMMLGSAKRRIGDNAEARGTIDKAQQRLVQAGADLRQLSHDLHPPLLQEAGLPKAVQAYCEEFSTASGIPVVCEADENVGELSRGAGLALFRIVQEALGNAAKYAKATRVVVRLARSGDAVSLTVSDDGVGFDRGRLAGGGGLGLVMMRERAGQLNGTFEFESAPGRGTTIRVAIPFR